MSDFFPKYLHLNRRGNRPSYVKTSRATSLPNYPKSTGVGEVPSFTIANPPPVSSGSFLASICHPFRNTPQTATASCPEGQSGLDVTITRAAGLFTSRVSQEEADNRAWQDALAEAESLLVCSTGVPFACSIFDPNWYGEISGWEFLAETLTGWITPPHTDIVPMCVRWVGFCNDTEGGIAAQHVVGMKPEATVQLTEEEYVALAAPWRRTGPGEETVIALRFYGYRPDFTHQNPLPPHRPCTGSTDHYVIRRKP